MTSSPSICFTCYKQYAGIMCPYCACDSIGPLDAARMTRQFAGQATDVATDATSSATDVAPTDATDAASSSAAASNVPASYMTSSAGTLPASWDDWMLLYPPLWIPYAAGKIIDPSQETDPETRRKQLGGIAQQLNTVRKSCTTLPAVDQTNWDTFAKSFIPWFDKDPSVWDQNLDKPQADLIQDQLRAWQTEFAKYCNIGMPLLPKSTPTVSQLGEDLLLDVGQFLSAAKWVLVVGAGLFLVSVAIIGVDNTRKIVTKAIV